jgi:two-component system, OmpR family, phosphate regulon sensor histidine kinase PhoR
MDLSLYQIAKDSQTASEPTTISLVAFKFLLSSLIDVAIAQEKPTILCLKLPIAEVWQAEVERYHRQARSHQLYCCLSDPEVWQNLIDSSTANRAIVPLTLEDPQLWRTEYFIIVLTEELNLGIFAQRLASTGESSAKKAQISVSLVHDFNVLEKIASVWKQALPTAPDLFKAPPTDNPVSSSTHAKILSQMLLQVLCKQDEARQANPKAINPEETIPSFTGFTPTANLVNQLLQELRTPLTSMKTALKLVGAETLKHPQRQRYVQMLDAQCDRQTSLLAGLLEFIQLQEATQRSPMQPLKLSEIIPVVVSTYQPLAQEKGIQLGYTVSDKLPAVFSLEPQLKQIVIRLLHNSVKFTPSGGRISVLATEKGRFVELEIRDTGIGISSSDLPQIFDWFYRGKTTSAGENTGAGIGLAIVQSLLESCGGSVFATSRVGNGSTFKVLLPAERSDATQVQSPTSD